MPITMAQSARYVTQQGIWSIRVLGPLTDRAILRYIKQGHYGKDIKEAWFTQKKPKPKRAVLVVPLTNRQKVNRKMKELLA